MITVNKIIKIPKINLGVDFQNTNNRNDANILKNMFAFT